MTDLRELLRNRAFLAIWSASLVSGLGDKIAIIALFLQVFRISGRAVDLGLLAAVQIVPAILLGPVVGLLLDRRDRRTAMIWCDLGSAVVAGALAWAHDLPVIYALAALLSAGRQIAGPARLALLPDIVPAAQLNRANALTMATQNLVLLVGPAIGGGLVALSGTAAAFGVNAVSFVASAALLGARGFVYLEEARTRRAAGATGAVAAASGRARLAAAGADIRETAFWLWRQPRLRFAFLFLAGLAFVTAMQQPLVIVFVKSVLRRGDVDLGLVLSAAGLGGLVGALAAGLLSRGRQTLRNITWIVAIDGLALVLFAVNRSFAGALLLFGLFGALGAAAQINLATFLQNETPEDRRGRVFGWLGPLLGPLSLLSVFCGPLAADALGVVRVLAVSGLFELVLGLAGRAFLPVRLAAQDATSPAESAPQAGELHASGTPDAT